MTSSILIIFLFINLLLFLGNKKIASILDLYDKPDNNRKTHKFNVPLTGGIIIILNIILISIYLLINTNNLLNLNVFLNKQDFLFFLICSVSVFLLGFFDDKFKISSTKKFLIMMLLFLILIILSNNLLIKEIRLSFIQNSYFLNNYISIIWTLLCFLLFVNALNMFDGINYQVTIYSIMICIYFILNDYYNIFFIILKISLLFFLVLNHYNKAFLGDSGSYLLAFIFSYFFIKFYNQTNIINADEIVLFMIIPGLDLMRLFIYRIYKGNYPFTPDRNHLHHIVLLNNNLIVTNIKIFSLTAIPVIINLYVGFTYLLLITQVIFYTYFILKK
ncbi:MraY family glycosyltransferase [Candidatus Pelagibacter sp.]|uniref:MraY family glycosyltransferase n=1 Tax=Candidatus Pelagibacter sp. TaxID=2024849 RepID=UPI003F82E7BE